MIKTIRAGEEIILGKTGENLATTIEFPINSYLSEYGRAGQFTLLNLRPGDEHSYPCSITRKSNTVEWHVAAADLTAEGVGKCELQYIINNVIVKSETWDTLIIPGIEAPGETPEPYEGWVESVLSAGAAAQSAKEAIESLGVAARTLSSSAEVKVIKTVDESGKVTLTFEIPRGATGDTGVGIADIEENYVNISGATNTITITLTDGTSKVIYLKNGVKGDPGSPGQQGEPGSPGQQGATGNSGVYIGTTEPTDLEQKVWINPEGISTDIPLYGKKLYVNGDSICYGKGYSGGYGKCIADTYGMTVINEGSDGATIATGVTGRTSITTSLLASLNLAAADYIIIEGGINDAWNGEAEPGTITATFDDTFDTTTTLGGLEKCLHQIRTNYPKKRLGFVFPHGGMLAASHDWNTVYKPGMKNVLAKWGIPFIDLEASTPPIGTYGISGLSGTFTIDGTHPNKDGYDTFYRDQIANFMKAMYSAENVLELNRLKSMLVDDYIYRQYVPKSNFMTTKYIDWETDYIEAEIDLTGCTNTSGEDVLSFGKVISEWKGYNFHSYYNCSTHVLTVQLVDFNYATTATRTLTDNMLKIRVEKYKVFINNVQANEFNETVALARNTFDNMIAAGNLEFGSNNSGAVSNARYVFVKIGKL